MGILAKNQKRVKSVTRSNLRCNAETLSAKERFELCVVPTFGKKFKKRDWFICECWAYGMPEHALKTLRSPGHTPKKWITLLKFFLRHHPGIAFVLKDSRP